MNVRLRTGESTVLDALVIAPHPDDAELGMGGTIAKLIDQEWQIGILDLTSGEPTPHGDETTRRREAACATDALRVPWRENLGLANRKLEATLAARAELANVFRRVRPRWLFAPYWVDAHPDHVAATHLIEEARFWSKLTKSELTGDPFHPSRVIYYFCTHLKLAVQPAFVVDISSQWSRKLASLRCYDSQLIKGHEHEEPTLLARLETYAAYWGHAIGKQYGEPFASREPIGLTSLNELI